MSVDEIQNFLKKNKITSENYLKISFKSRNAVYGIFISGQDSEEYEKKNFWRVVSFANLEEWNKHKDLSLSRIFNGQEFSKLSLEAVAVSR